MKTQLGTREDIEKLFTYYSSYTKLSYNSTENLNISWHSLKHRRDPLELALARRLKVIEVAVEFVEAALAKFTDFGV